MSEGTSRVGDVSEEESVELPVARVAVDVWLAHLDRFFDYLVTPDDDAEAVPGARVRVRFAGQTRDGFVVERVARSEIDAKLAPLAKVISPEPLLFSEQVRLIREVADHYAGTFADVMRLAVPPRHAATEKATPRPWPEPDLAGAPVPVLADTPDGAGFLAAIGRGEAPRAFWQVPAHFAGGVPAWAQGFAEAAHQALSAGRGVLVLVPDQRDLAHAKQALGEAFGERAVAELHADLGPSARYRNYLAVSRGTARIVVGTRAAAFAPVRDLGLIALWDDGDDLYAEERAPYWHARTVAALRAAGQKVPLLIASHGRTCEVEAWLQRGWLAPISLPARELRQAGPAVRAAGDSDTALRHDPLAASVRMPSLAFRTIRDGLAQGPVLVQVPRAGYAVALACSRCRTPARCGFCQGPLRVAGGAGRLECAWCARPAVPWQCATCGGTSLRAPVVGATRTVEELGRAFPGVPVLRSSGDRVVGEVGDAPQIVIATPGAEPYPLAGYAAAVFLDAQLALSRQDLRTSEETLRRWLNAAALVRGGGDGGTVAVVGPAGDRTVQALVRLDPGGLAARDLIERGEAGYPPAVRFATVEGEAAAVRDLLGVLRLPESAQVLGPADIDPDLVRAVIRTPPRDGAGLAQALKDAVSVRSARKAGGALRVRVDPAAVG